MELFVKLTIDEKNLIRNALRSHITWLECEVKKRENEPKTDKLTGIFRDTLKETEELYSEFTD